MCQGSFLLEMKSCLIFYINTCTLIRFSFTVLEFNKIIKHSFFGFGHSSRTTPKFLLPLLHLDSLDFVNSSGYTPTTSYADVATNIVSIYNDNRQWRTHYAPRAHGRPMDHDAPRSWSASQQQPASGFDPALR